jgi:hypothetical protein
MRRSIRIMLRLLALILPLALAMDAAADSQYAIVQNSKTGLTGAQATWATAALQSNWNDAAHSCNFVNQELWLALDATGDQWIEIGVTDGKINDALGGADCAGETVKHWTGSFTAYQYCRSADDCEYNEYPYAASEVGTSHTYKVLRVDGEWGSYIGDTRVMGFAQFAQATGQDPDVGMEGNGEGALTFGGAASTSGHQYRVGTTWYNWCNGVDQPTTDCATDADAPWSAAFGATRATANYQDHE